MSCQFSFKKMRRKKEINLILIRQAAGPNMVHFVRKLKSIHPDLLVSQPTYGYPQVSQENCEKKRKSNNDNFLPRFKPRVMLLTQAGTKAAPAMVWPTR